MKKYIVVLLTAALLLCGCDQQIDENIVVINDTENVSEDTSETSTVPVNTVTSNGEKTYVELSSGNIEITEGGIYELSGTLENGCVIVDVDDDEDVEIILSGVSIYTENFASIYIVNGDEATITLKEGTVNRLSTGSSYTQIDENSVDAVIYSKADLFLGGKGTLIIEANYKHGIVSKDDLVITGGVYEITALNHALVGKDLVEIHDGIFTLTTGKDSIVSDNEDDKDRGNVVIHDGNFTITSSADGIYAVNTLTIEDGSYEIDTVKKVLKADAEILISGGTFVIDAEDDGIHTDGSLTISGGKITLKSGDDAIHAEYKLTIKDGTLDLTAHEGLEATLVTIDGGDITISASDDGINAGAQVSGVTPTVEINGGNLTITMGQGDTDAIDSNGNLIINGGTVTISAQFPFDYDQTGQLNGGTVIVNGEEVSQLSNQFGGMGGMGGGNWPNGGFPSGQGGMNPPDGNFPGGGSTPPSGGGFPGGNGPQGGSPGGRR